MNAAPGMLRTRVLPAAAGAAMVAALAAGAWYGYGYATSLPIQRVVFVGDAGRIARADLEAFAQSVQGAGSSGASLAAVREAARRIPWVRDASVRRRFPDSIEVSFETHEPLARWAEGGLISTRGEVFVAEHAAFLPVFKGPSGAAQRMAETYPSIVKALSPLASAVVELRISARGGWMVLLESGLALELGREDIVPRIERFAAAWPQLVARGATPRHADLRYNSGFAMRQEGVAR
ncbi:MAG TPA: cell division protein FtsQ/DivIB [Usitatibacter sp.]|nr:cell division protein FtsQ/DivIB [Usitatibacter sp.]